MTAAAKTNSKAIPANVIVVAKGRHGEAWCPRPVTTQRGSAARRMRPLPVPPRAVRATRCFGEHWPVEDPVSLGIPAARPVRLGGTPRVLAVTSPKVDEKLVCLEMVQRCERAPGHVLILIGDKNFRGQEVEADLTRHQTRPHPPLPRPRDRRANYHRAPHPPRQGSRAARRRHPNTTKRPRTHALDHHRPRLRDPPPRHDSPAQPPRHHNEGTRRAIDNELSIAARNALEPR